jgi:hypothetical protein
LVKNASNWFKKMIKNTVIIGQIEVK